VPFSGGTLALKRTEFRDDERVIDENCDCSTCARGEGVTRGYLHSAFKTSTGAACRYVTVHNIAYQKRLMTQLRDGIIAGEFPQTVRTFFRNMYGGQGAENFPAWAVRALRSVGVDLEIIA
jgi:queuine tRNA-ribosyltransferase catalytic subunit